MWSLKERNFHINILGMKAVQIVLNTFLPTFVGESLMLMSNSAGISQDARGHDLSKHVQISSGRDQVVGTAYGT